MKRIALLLPDLRGGGAERVNILLAHEFVRLGYFVDLILLQKNGELLDQVPQGVQVVNLSASRVRNGFWSLARYLRSQKPDVLLASMWPLTTLAVFAAKVTRFRGCVVVLEHSALSRSPQNLGLSGLALRASMRWVNSLADNVVGVSSGVIDDLYELGLPAGIRGRVIHNPISISCRNTVPDTWADHPWIKYAPSQRLLAVGALKPAKDYETLLSAMKKVVDSGTDACLLVLGTGPLQAELEERRRALQLEGNVFFGGFVADPSPFYRAAGLFVLSSAWEGFGNVIVEAMAAGIPVVSTDCRSGPAEILEHGRYGRLVPVGDENALANAIIDSLAVTHDAKALQARAAEFSPEKIAQNYLELLTS